MTYKHVKQRAKERLNIDLSEFDFDYLNKMIQDNDCEYISKEHYAIKFKGRIFIVVYKNGEVRTVYKIQ